jgi:hypothetical protein
MTQKQDDIQSELTKELTRLRKQVFDFASNPKYDDKLWPTLERMYNDLLAENIRYREQISASNIAYNAMAKQWLAYEKALEDIVKASDGSGPSRIEIATKALGLKEEK